MVQRVAMAVSLTVALSAVVAVFAAQPGGNRDEIEAFYKAWMGGAVQKGPAAYASFYAADGMMLPPNDRPVSGRAAIEEFQKRAQATTPYAVKPTGVTADEVRFLGSDVAVYRSTLSGSRVARSDGSATPFETKYLDVLYRDTNGRWQVAYRMWSDNMN
jgi:uncharacterized protein (TIGR02246 family)